MLPKRNIFKQHIFILKKGAQIGMTKTS